MSLNLHFLPGWGFHASLGETLLAPLHRPCSFHAQPPQAGALPPRSVLIGWSLGAMRALQLAHAAPERVAGLFLIGANLRFAACPAWPHGLEERIVQRFAADFARAPERCLQRFLALQTLGDARHGETLACLRPHRMRADQDLAALRSSLDELLALDLATAPLPACPLHLLHGEHDALMPVAAARAIAARARSAQLTCVASAGHAPLFSQSEAFAAQLNNFLDALH